MVLGSHTNSLSYCVNEGTEDTVDIHEIIKQRGLSARDISKKYKIPVNTLSESYNKQVNDWSVKTFRATADAVQLSLDGLVSELEKPETLHPFIKWVGGKRQLLASIHELLPRRFNTYYEPFLGGGAVLLNLQPKHAVVGDFNDELMNTWTVVRDQTSELLDLLDQYKKNNSKEFYLDLRMADRDGRIQQFSNLQRAARFIYMNKTGFNGLWRVNRKGQNNVPYGKYTNPKIADPIIKSVGDYLRNAQVDMHSGDYRDTLASVKKDDFVYFDSPYDVVSPTSSFTSYTKEDFNNKDQVELRDSFVQLKNKGVLVMESNADTPSIRKLYGNIDGVYLNVVHANRAINSVGSKRGKVNELIITSYKTAIKHE